METKFCNCNYIENHSIDVALIGIVNCLINFMLFVNQLA